MKKMFLKSVVLAAASCLLAAVVAGYSQKPSDRIFTCKLHSISENQEKVLDCGSEFSLVIPADEWPDNWRGEGPYKVRRYTDENGELHQTAMPTKTYCEEETRKVWLKVCGVDGDYCRPPVQSVQVKGCPVN